MANIPQIIAQIRFQLDQLSVNNAHHDFEHLCRHLTRARICSNILPATGPVSAGGDQGRDFETFRTYLNSSSIANSTFIGLASDETIVFACSLQKENIRTKIKHDINTIMSQGSIVSTIIYFCTSDIPVSRRHELQDWARKEYSIELEIHGGDSISESLSDRETFWIAGEYLNIPFEIYPRIEQEGNWYSKVFEKWKNPENFSFNYADFYEISTAARYATFDDHTVRQDIPFWISLLEKFQEEEFPVNMRRHSIYEISIVSLRGIGTLIGRENIIREYFSILSELNDFNELDGAVALLNYCISAFHAGLIEITLEELNEWHTSLLEKIEHKINVVKEIGFKCQLLELRGFITFYPSENTHIIDFSETINNWLRLVEIVKDAPLFPLDRFSDRLTEFSKYIGDDPHYDELTEKVDILLSKRYGEFKAAEKCRDRAMVFYKEGKILKAINQLHQAKIKWFAEETLYGSLLAIILISQWYLELGLSFAAKYYALAAAYIAHHSSNQNVKKFIPQSLFISSECDYVQGAWCGFWELFRIALLAHLTLSKEPNDIEKHEELFKTLYCSSMLTFTTQNFFGEDLNVFVENMLNMCYGFDKLIEEYTSEAEEKFPIRNIDDLWVELENQLEGRPFGDCGHMREVSWSELGITWKICWENNYENTIVSEQFIAILQIFMVDLANIDLCLLKTDIDVLISVNDEINDPHIEPIPSNDGRKWKIEFPPYENNGDIKNLQIKFIGLVSHILYEVSLLPSDKFDEIIKNCFKNEISMKTFIARPYADLLNETITQDIFDETSRSTKKVPEMQRSFELHPYGELKWFDGPGIGYSEEESKEMIKSRYERAIVPIKYTVERLAKDPEFIPIIEKLREDGWLDWHILLTINNIALRYRIEENMREYPIPFVDKKTWYQNEWEMIIDNEESKNSSIIPTLEFNEENIRMSLNVSMISTLRLLGLECKQQTPDFEAINHFLSNRYNYWNDDVEHEEIF
ncbi:MULTISPECIES: hypothetical protein [Methanobacterium]|uniref:Uncharacterized protein n=1 Tax=Methanobacterium veterum TaxID=408577 RepID=A0A9E5DMT2_9EURY|nr:MULTISPECIES: hypothetical protein [Methanobacterium]MCZ3365419.1 hypothetical protein [Methanobacterium veterum]MCZ3373170.1 hypothetical protein [Methanobacterium veterum]